MGSGFFLKQCMVEVLVLVVIIFSSSAFCNKTQSKTAFNSTLIESLITTTTISSESILRNGDVKLSTKDLIAKYGYPVEEHKVTTGDGYILTLFRIPSGKISKNPAKKKTKKVVLLVHGFFGSSTDWIENYHENALAYVLADSNSDVWLANLRGNVYSQEHKFLDPESSDYWNFSFHEMGQHDIPTTIDYILNKTNQTNLYYVAHSLGNNVLFITTSLHPEYSNKIKILFALAPGIYVDNMSSPLRFLAPLAYNENVALGALGRNELAPTVPIHLMQQFGASTACSFGTAFTELCMSALYLMANVDNTQVNMTWLPVILANYPNGASSKTLVHLLQVFNSRTFQEYDYGYFGNMKYYANIHPREYNISNLKAPVAIFSAHDDILAAPVDVTRLRKKVTRVVHNEFISEGSFGHFGFLFSNKARKLVYNKIVDIIKRIN